jgi:hypothetical protein
MKRLHEYLGGTQAQRTNADQKQPYESRPNWSFLYPTRDKREPWQGDFAGVVRLSATGARYWVNLWASDTYRLRLSEKRGLLKTPICQLVSVGPDRQTSELPLFDEDSSRQFMLHVDLQKTGQRWLEIHFETILEKEDR